MRFVFDGTPPPQRQVNIDSARVLPGGPPIDEPLVVDPKSKGIQNVLVYVHKGLSGSKIVLPPASNQIRCLIMANARFDPHILIAQAGDTLELVDRGPNQHNPNLNFFANNVRGILVPPRNILRVVVPKPDPAPISVDCNIHPWMRAYVVVLHHHFAAVSDSDGNIAITGLPTDTTLTFRVFHEAGRIERVKILGVDTDWPKSRFDVKLNGGENNLGDVQVPSESLIP